MGLINGREFLHFCKESLQNNANKDGTNG